MNRKTLLITGVTRGLGRAMVDEFVRLGHTVIGSGRTQDRIAELHQRFSAPHDFSVVDVASEEQVKEWATRVLKSHGPPDLLLNNAAVMNKNAPLWKIGAREFSQVIDINIKGVANVIRHFVPAIGVRRAGVIVTFSSSWRRSPDAEVS